MTRPDIDCTVDNPAVDLELALGALTRFIRVRDFHGFAFLDWDRPTPSLGLSSPPATARVRVG